MKNTFEAAYETASWELNRLGVRRDLRRFFSKVAAEVAVTTANEPTAAASIFDTLIAASAGEYVSRRGLQLVARATATCVSFISR